MPVYEYQCGACKHLFEEWQKITDAPIRTCPKCKKKKVERLISMTAFHLKGGGWYSDLYSSKKPGGESADKSEKTEKSEKTDKIEKTDKGGGGGDGGGGGATGGGEGGGKAKDTAVKSSPAPAKPSKKDKGSKSAPANA